MPLMPFFSEPFLWLSLGTDDMWSPFLCVHSSKHLVICTFLCCSSPLLNVSSTGAWNLSISAHHRHPSDENTTLQVRVPVQGECSIEVMQGNESNHQVHQPLCFHETRSPLLKLVFDTKKVGFKETEI